MRRRNFLAAFAAAGVTGPIAAMAQLYFAKIRLGRRLDQLRGDIHSG